MEGEETMALWRTQKEADVPEGPSEGRLGPGGLCGLLDGGASSSAPQEGASPLAVRSTLSPIRKSLPLAKLPRD